MSANLTPGELLKLARLTERLNPKEIRLYEAYVVFNWEGRAIKALTRAEFNELPIDVLITRFY